MPVFITKKQKPGIHNLAFKKKEEMRQFIVCKMTEIDGA